MAELKEHLSNEDLEELHAAFVLKTFRQVVRAVKLSGLDQQTVADRIDMDPGQLSKILSGRQNVTIKTLYNIARAANHRLEISLVNLAELAEGRAKSSSVDELVKSGAAAVQSNVIELDFSKVKTAGSGAEKSFMLAASS